MVRSRNFNRGIIGLLKLFLKKFFLFIDKYYSRIDNISQITKNVLIDYYDYLKEVNDKNDKGLSIKTISHRITVLKSFFKFLYYDDYIINNPAMNIRLPRVENTLNNKVLTEEDIFINWLNWTYAVSVNSTYSVFLNNMSISSF